MNCLQNSLPVTVLTGFLGSGKTTLLSALLKKPEMKGTAVIINEFGKVGLDHALIERTDENVVELQNGCICCTIREDLHKTLLDLLDRMARGRIAPFDRVVIETTGLADPVPIIHTLMTSYDLQRIYTLDGVITLVDAASGGSTLDAHPESVKQAALAEKIILSKTDIADRARVDALLARLRDINPSVEIITASHGEVAVADLFGFGSYDPYTKSRDVTAWLAAESFKEPHHHHHHNVNRHGRDIEAFALTHDTPVGAQAFKFFLDLIMAQAGPNLLRIKGIVHIAGEDRPAVIHGVQHVFHPIQWLERWPDEDRRTRVVFITQRIPKAEVENFFKALMNVAHEDSTPQEIATAWIQAYGSEATTGV